ncbi:MAG: phosphorylcholine transferase LicD [Candidatus Hamiltonella defensa (Ceratovacuna japonica)]
MTIEKSVLRQAQLLLLEGLKEIDRICNKHNINYWIDSGTLLGAKRHGGFIPWDDDIDICMIREDFNKFIKISESEINKEKYFLHTIYSDPFHYLNCPSRLRILGTKLRPKGVKKYGRSVSGLFIDILPFDKYSKFYFKRKYIERMLSLLFRIKTGSQYPSPRFWRAVLSKTFGIFLSRNFLLKLAKYLSNSFSKKTKNYIYAYGVEVSYSRYIFKKETLFPINKIVFEGTKFNCPNNIEEYLKQIYGPDYMIEPPEEAREVHFCNIEISLRK